MSTMLIVTGLVTVSPGLTVQVTVRLLWLHAIAFATAVMSAVGPT